jgi:adenylosuccinate lyase
MNELEISPLDGRYKDRLKDLSEYFSESALMYTRCDVEISYASFLERKTNVFPIFTWQERDAISDYMSAALYGDFGLQRIKEIESVVNHDVKACEIFLREKLNLSNPNIIHFGLTSEDINNLSYSILFRDFKCERQQFLLKNILEKLISMAEEYKADSFPAHTHGQMASPTTAGKEIAVFISRLTKLYKKLCAFNFSGKLNGATGNYSAMMSAAPHIDWMEFSKSFITYMGLEPNIVTTQIEDHDCWAEYFNLVRQINNVIMDLDQDMWLYLSYGYFTQEVKVEEVGSSTMPHKVNPINFENSEGNLSLSNALLVEMSNKLCRSRMQRDLSDSTVIRNVGVALSHSYLGWQETLKGLSKLTLNKEFCINELWAHPELLAEPVQTILKVAGVQDPYELLKGFTRGSKVNMEDLIDFAEDLDVDEAVKEKLRLLTVSEYTGLAQKICEMTIEDAKKELRLIYERRNN